MSLFARWRRLLDDLRSQDRYRQLAVPCGLDFSSNDYLGYAKRRAGSVSDRSTLSHSGQASRLLRGHHALWDEVESMLARWHGAEAALMFNTGYTANEGLLSTVLGPDDFVASDEHNHASIIDGIRLTKAERFVFRHNDLDQLETGLRAATTRPGGRERFIVTEALFGMEGDRAPLCDIAELAERYHAHLIVDEAHSTGCFGAEGAGLVDELGLRPRVLATMHTGGKALGVCGAYLACSKLLRDVLVNRCRHLIFTTALPPVVAGWWLDMLPHDCQDRSTRQKLHDNALLFRAELGGIVALGRDYLVPIVLGEDCRAVSAAQTLQSAGFDVRAIRPPTVPQGTARLRVSIHADHEKSDLRRLAQLLRTIHGEPGASATGVEYTAAPPPVADAPGSPGGVP